MTDAIYRCHDHGLVTGPDGSDPRCPECETEVERVLSGDRRRRLSKFVSGALRHFPEDAGLELDDSGWTEWNDLADAIARKYDWADAAHLAAVVETDPKGRFEREGNRVRAAYGHSVDVDLETSESDVPDRLYHGTSPENLESILREGLQSMDRQEVHLSATAAEARDVGSRHGANPVLLVVDAAEMVADGFRVTRRGAVTYTADEVPPAYLTVETR